MNPALWNVVIFAIFLAYAIVSNWLVLTQSLQDLVVVIASLRIILALFLAMVQDCLGTATPMYYSRALLLVVTLALLLLWALGGRCSDA